MHIMSKYQKQTTQETKNIIYKTYKKYILNFKVWVKTEVEIFAESDIPYASTKILGNISINKIGENIGRKLLI